MAAVKAELQGLQGMEAELSRSLAGMKTKQVCTLTYWYFVQPC
jgi:hypothetical protein